MHEISKKSAFWLRLLKETNDVSLKEEFNELIQEGNELKLIFNSIINKKSNK